MTIVRTIQGHPVTDLASIRKRLLSFIRKRVSSFDDAEDLVQDILFRSFGESITGPLEDLTAYLFQSTRNRIVDYYRKRSRHQEEPLPDFFPDGSDPDSRRLRELIWEELADALEELPEPQREAFVRNELQGESFREMSLATGTNMNTLLARKRYAVLYLRERLRSLYEELG